MNLAGAPDGAMRDLRFAMHAVNAASGLRFQIVGKSSVTPGPAWGDRIARRHPSGWPPVLLGWSARKSQFGGASAETYTVSIENTSRRLVIVTGAVALNRLQNHLFRSGPVTMMSRRALMEHEFGHLLGLDHVSSLGEVMNPVVGAVAGYQAGDLAGLRQLGLGSCLLVPTNPGSD